MRPYRLVSWEVGGTEGREVWDKYNKYIIWNSLKSLIKVKNKQAQSTFYKDGHLVCQNKVKVINIQRLDKNEGNNMIIMLFSN